MLTSASVATMQDDPHEQKMKQQCCAMSMQTCIRRGSLTGPAGLQGTYGTLTLLGLPLQVYKPTSADVIIMRDFVHGQKVKEATLRYGQVDVHKKEVKDKTSKAAQKQDKKAAARVMRGLQVVH